ncbi:MAG: 50S ribosomal protein L23 [Nanoarchaeota archaeon]
MAIKPITTEKAVKLIELENTLIFQTDRKMRKADIKKEVEEMFNVKVEKIRVLIRGNHKNAYVKLNKKNPAIDVATKIGMI